MAKKQSLLSALSSFRKAVGQSKKTRTISGKKKRKPAKKTTKKKSSGKGKARKSLPSRKKGKAKPRSRTVRKRQKAKPFLATVSKADRARIAKRGVLKLSGKQRKEFLRLKRMVNARRKLTDKERTTYDRLSKQVLNNKIAAADKASINKQSSRKARSKASGRRKRKHPLISALSDYGKAVGRSKKTRTRNGRIKRKR